MDQVGDSVQALELEAEQLEQALLGLELPVRVSGGEVARGRVRYHLTPLPAGPARRLREAAGEVARALGVPEVTVTAEGSELMIEVPCWRNGVRLLPLIRSLTGLRPHTAVVGLSQAGHPALLCLTAGSTWHVQVVGPRGAGKSDLLRTLALSLAMTTRPAQLRMLAVDVGGREMAVLESLPHLAADLASDPTAGARLVGWLATQAEARLAGRACGPEWLLLLDDLPWLAAPSQEAARSAIDLLLARGPEVGVHVMAVCQSGSDVSRCLHFPPKNSLKVEGRSEGMPGRFRLTAVNEDLVVRAAWLPLADLDRAVRWISAGWHAG